MKRGTIAAAGAALVLALTLFPFDFRAGRPGRFDWSLVADRPLADVPLNVVLFVPFGFGLGRLWARATLLVPNHIDEPEASSTIRSWPLSTSIALTLRASPSNSASPSTSAKKGFEARTRRASMAPLQGLAGQPHAVRYLARSPIP